MKIVVSKDLEELSSRAAAEFVRIASGSIAERQVFTVALSGGSTPKALYKRLVDSDLDWNKVYFFFGDERNVPPDDEQSNFRMADENLFGPLSIASDKVYRWETDIRAPQRIAATYADSINNFFATPTLPSHARDSELPRFDIVLLGMGSDGHTASLFPNTTALNETKKLAVANWVPQLDKWRYTLTYPVINNARNIMFLVAGTDKAETLKEVIDGNRRPKRLPSQSVNPTDGELHWFVDETAADHLTHK